MVRVQRRQQAQAAGQRTVRRVSQHAAVGTHNKRQILRASVFVAQQLGAMRIGIWIDRGMRMSVAGQETLQAQHVGVFRRAHENGSAAGAFDQGNAAQDQRAHDAFADFGLADQQGAQLLRPQQQRAHIGARDVVHQRRAAAQLRNLAHETARAVCGDKDRFAQRVAADDVHRALQQDEHARRGNARFQQFVARGESGFGGEPADAGDFGG